MTVHQSKGLEFPICILADMQHKFNERDNSDSVLINSYAGLGMKRRTEDGISVYDTAPRRAAVIMSERMGRSEELRVLYVALTRAKENLIMVTSVPNPEKSLAKVAVECGIGEKANPFAVLRMNNFSDLVLTALMRHPSAEELRKLAGIDVPVLNSDKDKFKLKVAVSDSQSVLKRKRRGASCARILFSMTKSAPGSTIPTRARCSRPCPRSAPRRTARSAA